MDKTSKHVATLERGGDSRLHLLDRTRDLHLGYFVRLAETFGVAGVRAKGAAELIEYCRATIAPYKKPRSIEFVDALPRAGFVVEDVSGLPAGVSASFNPATVTAGQSTTLNLSSSLSTATSACISAQGVPETVRSASRLPFA